MNVRWLMVVGAVACMAATGCDRLSGKDESSGNGESSEDGDKSPKESKGGDGKLDAKATDAKAPEKFGGKVFKVGETVELSGVNVTVKQVKTCKYQRENRQTSLEKRGLRMVAVQLLFEGTSEKRSRVSRVFRAYDENRVVVNMSGLNGTDCTPDLKHTNLNAGDKLLGWVGFKVPADAKGLTARFEYLPPRQKGDKKPPRKQFPEFSLE